MGFPYLSTFIYTYLKPLASSGTTVNLKGQCIIVDGNSSMYSIYDQAMARDKNRSKAERITKSPFGYDAYSELVHKVFSEFKKKCAKVTVVFDGVYHRHPRKRRDPERLSSMRFAEASGIRHPLPSLFRQQFEKALRELDFEVICARGEADPMIVALAGERNAYIVANDCDYHLYDIGQGYVPLRLLNQKNLKGPMYRMEDIFEGLDVSAVALWAAFIGYNFVTLKALTNFFRDFHPHDEEVFLEWLARDTPDGLKESWLRAEYYLLRFLQQQKGGPAYQRLIQLIPSDQLAAFNQVRCSYTNVCPVDTIQTRGGQKLPSFIDRLFVSGELSHQIINIFISRRVQIDKDLDLEVFYDFLLPIIQLVIKWDRPEVTTESCSLVTFKGRPRDPLESINVAELVTAEQMAKMPENDRKACLLSCVQSALGKSMIEDANLLGNDQLVWRCLLKLWYKKGQANTSSKDIVLRAMVISYLNRELLAVTNSDQSQSLKCFGKQLKKKVTVDQFHAIAKAIASKIDVDDDNEQIKKELEEFQSFYKLFYIANQFFDQPLSIPDPKEYGIEAAYYLAIRIENWRNPNHTIFETLFKGNTYLIAFFEHIVALVQKGPDPSAENQLSEAMPELSSVPAQISMDSRPVQ